ncbi:MAG: Zn-dependent hydrolase [Ruminococcaceae bacterium]|nr:Zn-dependent hydrolase [Oscillospiraceae bacterium]
MKKTYITTMPDHIGAFLRASECFSALGINITRVSYNKAVDSHTLFIDAEGSDEQLAEADKQLAEIGYLQNEKSSNSIVLLEFRLRDVPGSVTKILSLISEFNFNISYISSQENGSDYQLFKMGLFVDDPEKITEFIAMAEKLCRIRVIDYNHSEKVYDNSIFYNSFVSGLSETMGLSHEIKNDLLVNANLAMQVLDEQGLSPYKTFESISRFADLLAACRKNAFSPRISHHQITENTEVILIEPPCGSNTAIIKSMGQVLFIDSGYALYRDEMESIFRGIIDGFDSIEKKILLTHADVDHCGLLPIFDEVIASRETAECLRLEYENKNGYREQNPLHKPYINICKILTSYSPISPDKIKGLWGRDVGSDEPLTQVGFFSFGEMHFEVYEGKGGHLPGETVLIDYAHHVAFTGDIYINLKGLTAEQSEYNQYAPILMTSVDTDPKLCSIERSAILQRLGSGKWQIFGAHGYKKDYSVTIG